MKKKRNNKQQSVVVLGSTGSIGVNTLEVIRRFHDRFNLIGISAGSNITMLKKQIDCYHPRYVAVFDQDRARQLQRARPRVKVFAGLDGMCELASLAGVDTVVMSITGSIALVPLLAAIRSSKKVALANKESLVVGGHLVKAQLAKNKKARIVPIDSEQNAIFQCLQGYEHRMIRTLYLTASGGPFLGYKRSQLQNVLPQTALAHPRWNMGKKISIDSATLMNKGLEVIEAQWLFDMPVDAIQVIIHREAIIHSLVEFIDGSLLGQLSVTDMKLPIQYALSYPDRWQTNGAMRLDFTRLKSLSFSAPDTKKFPCLGLAYHAAKKSGVAPCVLNAANEEAVDAFLGHRISFVKIPAIIENVLKKYENHKSAASLDEILAVEAAARNHAQELIKRRGVR